MTPLGELLALVLLVPPIAILHEAGHALAAPLAGYRVTSFGLGLGRSFRSWRTPWGWVLHLGRWLLAGGSCVAIPERLRARRAIYHAGGLVAQLGLALALRPLADQHVLLARAEAFNLAVLLWNSVPWRWRGQASDGWWLLMPLIRGRQAGPLMGPRAVLQRLASHQRQVGALLGEWYAQLCLAWLDTVLGQPQAAEPFFARAIPAELSEGRQALLGLHGYVLAEARRVAGRPEEALSGARQLLHGVPEELPAEARDLLVLAQGRALLELGRGDEAAQLLESRRGEGGSVDNDLIALELAVALAQHRLGPFGPAAQRLLQRMSGPFLDPVEAARVLWDAAEQLPEEQRAPLARAAQRSAARLLAWAEPRDRQALLLRLGPVAGLKGQAGEDQAAPQDPAE